MYESITRRMRRENTDSQTVSKFLEQQTRYDVFVLPKHTIIYFRLTHRGKTSIYVYKNKKEFIKRQITTIRLTIKFINKDLFTF